MADRMIVNEEAFNTAINNFNAKKIAMQACYMKAMTTVNDLQGVWKGEANAAFTDKFNELYKNVEKTEQVMDTIIEKLKTALSTFEQQESQIRSMFEAAEQGTAYQSPL